MSRMLLGVTALVSIALPASAIAATTSINYAAIVRATEASVARYKSAVAQCAGDTACLKSADKILKSAQFRIANVANDPALTPAVQRANQRALGQILNNALNCATTAEACAKQNSKTLSSIIYRVTNQPPISPA
jgi:hypothetical protein